jgi:8-oxo-dGTP pyrophosphatase MutT (NUDIX family)
LEETGVKATFEKVVYFRELTGQIYNCVDLYYVCLMTLEEEPLPQLQVCEREISSYQWVGLDDYE